tara:strand:- start:264 stop:857 length:594 start_codon:yes stop_codon:yes gene_type:complete
MNELIQIIKLLETEQVIEINEYIDNLSFHTNTVFANNEDKSKVDTSIRTSTGTYLDNNHPITGKFHAKMNEGLKEYKRRVEKIHSNFSYYPVPSGYDTTCWREEIQILQYEKTQEYKFHHDAATNPELQEYHRKISVITYLSDGFIGGGTAFPHATFKPKPGYAIIFPSNWCYPHAGEPVKEGRKRVAVTWYYVNQA